MQPPLPKQEEPLPRRQTRTLRQKLRARPQLHEDDRLDQHMLCAVVDVDVAHMVTTSALKSGDLGQARAAAELAAPSAPHEEIPRLDLAAVAAAEGHAREAQRILREDVCDRSDDGEAPMELPERTESIIRSHDWLTRGEAAS